MFGRSKARKEKKQAAIEKSMQDERIDVEEIDPAVVAAITAAVAACLGTSSNGILIKSIRRMRSTLPVWGFTGRIEQLTNRF